jgi:hypothetical protein
MSHNVVQFLENSGRFGEKCRLQLQGLEVSKNSPL